MDAVIVWDIVLSCASFVLAGLSIVFVVLTIRQNNRMIEASTRPFICVYGESVNSGSPEFFLVIKNFGASAATITKFLIDEDLRNCYGMNLPLDTLDTVAGSIFAPGQSRICRLDYAKVPDLLHISLEYSSGEKKYSEKISANIKAGANMITTKIDTKGKELRTISYTLQEMVQKKL